MARTLLVMRHGKSKWDEAGVGDHDRSLTKRGKRDARRMGEEICARGLLPDIILSSTAKRAAGTARRVAETSGYLGEIAYEPDIYFGDVASCIELLSTLGRSPVGNSAHVAMLIGHNPTLENLVDFHTSRHIHLATATLVCIKLPIDDWAELDENILGDLDLVLRPRELAQL